MLLCVIGGNMLVESFPKKEDTPPSALMGKEMLLLALATSMDALAVGIAFAFLDVPIAPSATLIGVITFTLSAVGFYMGHVLGTRFDAIAERLGGAAFIAMGIEVFVGHPFW